MELRGTRNNERRACMKAVLGTQGLIAATFLGTLELSDMQPGCGERRFPPKDWTLEGSV
jgi:hypothetical protein